MSEEYSTSAPSWYRLAGLRLQLRPGVTVRRQLFRGTVWYVLCEPMSNQFTRLHKDAYQFMALLDGRRTLEEAWQLWRQAMGQDVLTRADIFHVLLQLYDANLLQADQVPDAEGLFRRHQKNIRRKALGVLANLMSIRLPLLNPDAFLNRWVPLVGWLFSPLGLGLWLILIVAGLAAVVSGASELAAEAGDMLAPSRLWILYLCLAGLSAIHELAHAFACKELGRRQGGGGQVHAMGIMLLVLLPLPYTDVSSSWSLGGKWHRILVNAAGIMAELACAAVMALVWAATAPTSMIHSVACNLLLVAGVSTVLFNGNPLLRYDGYYILSDLVEIPNLYARSTQQLLHLVKRYLWRVKNLTSPADSPGEAAWLTVYGLLSVPYRLILCVLVLWLVIDRYPMIGSVMAASAAVAWLLVPLGRLVLYLLRNRELERVRWRAVASVVGVCGAIAAAATWLPLPDRLVLEGVTEPSGLAEVHAGADGFITQCLPSGPVPQGMGLVQLANSELGSLKTAFEARLRGLASERDAAVSQDHPEQAQALDQQLSVAQADIDSLSADVAALAARAPLAGNWICPDADSKVGSFVRKGQKLGLVADMSQMTVRATATQEVAGQLSHLPPKAKVCLRGRMDTLLEADILEILPAGQKRLPSPAMADAAGGSIVTARDQTGQLEPQERVFEVRLRCQPSAPLLAGQCVLVRIEMPPTTLVDRARQWLGQVLRH